MPVGVLDLFREVLQVSVGQRAAKLWSVKLWWWSHHPEIEPELPPQGVLKIQQVKIESLTFQSKSVWLNYDLEWFWVYLGTPYTPTSAGPKKALMSFGLFKKLCKFDLAQKVPTIKVCTFKFLRKKTSIVTLVINFWATSFRAKLDTFFESSKVWH